jgi:hypothetical protein
VRVDRLGRDGEPVAALAALDQPGQRGPQPRHLLLQRVAGRRLAGPQVVDEPVSRDERPRLQREAHEQLGRLAAGHDDRLAVAADLERAEQRDVVAHRASVRALSAAL